MSKLINIPFWQLQQWQQSLAIRQNVSTGSKPVFLYVIDSYP
jgi:hypothetical protein